MIDQTYGLTHPLGIATIYLKPEEFSPHWVEDMPAILRRPLSGFSSNKTTRAEITDKITQFYEDGHLDHLPSEPRHQAIEKLHDDTKEFAKLIVKTRLRPNSLNNMGALPHPDDFRNPEDATPEDYRPPVRSVIVMPFETTGGKYIHEAMVNNGAELPDRPGTDAQYHFNALWHEIGHGTGAMEPQTETIAAVVTRKAFEDTTCLSAHADARAVRAITHHFGLADDEQVIIPERESYGWPMVEANDYVQGLPQSIIDGMDEEAITNIRFQKFDYIGESVQMVAEMMRDYSEEAWITGDLEQLGNVAGEIKNSLFLDETEKQIAARFQLACERLRHGAPAYEQGNDLIDEELLESEHQRPVTFDPGEYIPE